MEKPEASNQKAPTINARTFYQILSINVPVAAGWSDKSDSDIVHAPPAMAFRTPDKTSAL
jgi:hypothetical protein